MKKARFLAACLAVFFALAVSGGAAAQQPDAGVPPPEPSAQEAQHALDERFLNLERRIYDQNATALGRMEQVERRIDFSQNHLDRVLLIFALAIAVGFLFVITNLRLAQKKALDKMTRATRDAEGLMHDIQRELNRPEMEHWRISQILRRLLRQLRDPGHAMSAATYIGTVREACTDPYMPVSLHFIARVLSAEYDGNWNIAAQMLEQMREMDPNDPDVLLHLSHVHKNIASRSAEGRTRARHQRLSYQYFSQYTVAMQAEGLPIVADDGSADKDAGAVVADAPAQIAPTQTDAAADPAPAAAQKTDTPATTTPADTADTAKPAKAPAASPATTEKDAKSTTAPAAPAAAADAATSETAKATAAKPAKTAAASAKTAPADTASETTAPAKPARAGKTKGISLRDTLSKVGDSVSAATASISALAAPDDGSLPFLPVPAIADIPDDATGDPLKMWQAIQHGDTIMTRAAAAKTVRERNRMIDAAIADYTRAQSHSTNRILYHNWGVALLAKALHVSAKKRAPLYNAAVDKFLAGNVIAPHFFDFHLASLHAIIGNKDECHNWLKTARENGVLDSDALRQAPDFDSVRNQPWFDEFLEA